MFKWYVIQAKPGLADRAQQELENQGFDTYQPKIWVEKIVKRQRKRRLEALFPGYIFIYLSELESDWRPIRSTRGVSKLVAFGGQPASVPSDIIQSIKDQISDDSTAEKSALEKNQTLEITEGPFINLRALFDTYDGEERAYVLLNMLGKWQRIAIELNMLKPVDGS